MFKNEKFFIYAYLVLLRGMSNDEDVKRELLSKIYDKESGNGIKCLYEMNVLMHKYGLNTHWLK
jgi:hypothetical protein